MSLKQELQDNLRQAGLKPAHRFGQNFMIDQSAVDCLLETAQLQTHDRVIEVGPGTGIVTAQLLERVSAVLAVEIDSGLARWLQSHFAATSLQLVHADALKNKNELHPAIQEFAQQDWKLVANLPYEISIPLLLNAMCLPRQPQRIAVTVQAEAAERLCARPGSKIWGASAALAQSAGHGRIVRRLGPQIFYPQPRVQSVILEWIITDTILPGFSSWCRALFAYRRKVISRALRDCGLERERAQDLCQHLGLNDGQRVEDLDVTELRSLFLEQSGLEEL